jgi:hypothetical protein
MLLGLTRRTEEDRFTNGMYEGRERRMIEDAKKRKLIPLASGVLDYFPLALCAVAECSQKGNDQHNPGQPLHWAREKSGDHRDALMRHLIDKDKMDTDGVLHAAKCAWRALAYLEELLERGT